MRKSPGRIFQIVSIVFEPTANFSKILRDLADFIFSFIRSNCFNHSPILIDRIVRYFGKHFESLCDLPKK